MTAAGEHASVPVSPQVTLVDLVRAHVRERPDEAAVTHHLGPSLTYRELWEESGRLTAALHTAGIGPAEAVAITGERSIEMVVAMLGVLRLGAYYVLLDPYSPAARNMLMVEEVRARALIEATAGDSVRSGWSATAIPHRFSLPLSADAPGDAVPHEYRSSPADTRYIAYTSGSTGRPKGTITSDRAVVNFLLDDVLCRVSPGDRVASLSSPASDATTLEIWKPLAMGATIVILPHVAELDAPDWPELLRAQRVTLMFMMAGLVELIAQEDPAAFASLDTLIFGGEALNPQTALRICAAGSPRRLVLGYGPTECTVFSTSYDCTPEALSGRDRIPLGFPLRNYELSIVDDNLREVADSQVGELCVGGPSTGDGYLGRPELTSQRFIRLPGRDQPVYRTGDLVRRLPDGAIEFVARVDRQVKIRGFRVELEEVERVIVATGMAKAAVVEKANTEPSHLVCVFVPATGGPPPQASPVLRETDMGAQLTAALAALLPGYMIPARWFAVPELPFTAIGKVDRKKLLDAIPPRGGK